MRDCWLQRDNLRQGAYGREEALEDFRNGIQDRDSIEKRQKF